MIQLSKLNGQSILVNPFQIEYIDFIPETRIVMMNGKFHIVAEDRDEVETSIKTFYKKILSEKK